jgi:hypothetical protein
MTLVEAFAISCYIVFMCFTPLIFYRVTQLKRFLIVEIFTVALCLISIGPIISFARG